LAPQQADFTRTKTVIERSQANYGIRSSQRVVPASNGQKPVQKAAAAAVAQEFPFDENRLF
jgi:hypothetical protein